MGFLAIPTMSGSAAYALAETFGWDQGLDREWKTARNFYAVIIVSMTLAVLFNFIGFNPIQALYWSAVINGLLSPFLLGGILLVMCDKAIMPSENAPLHSKFILGLTMLLMFGAAIGMFVF